MLQAAKVDCMGTSHLIVVHFHYVQAPPSRTSLRRCSTMPVNELAPATRSACRKHASGGDDELVSKRQKMANGSNTSKAGAHEDANEQRLAASRIKRGVAAKSALGPLLKPSSRGRKSIKEARM